MEEVSAVFLSAGKGTRSEPFTEGGNYPKGMMRLQGRNFTEIMAKEFSEAGIKEGLIIAKDSGNRTRLRDALGYKIFDMSLKYSRASDDHTNIGSGDALFTNLIDRWNVDGYSLITANDHVLDLGNSKGLEEIIQNHKTEEAFMTVLSTKLPVEQIVNRYGLINLGSKNVINGFFEKPKSVEEAHNLLNNNDESVLVNTGVYIVNNLLLKEIYNTNKWAKYRINSKGEHGKSFDIGTDLIPLAIDSGYKVTNHEIKAWGDCGTIGLYLDTMKRSLNGDFPSLISTLSNDYSITMGKNCYIHSSSLSMRDTLSGTTLQEKINNGKVEIGPNTFIGPGCMIYDGVKVHHSDIEDGSTIGRNTEIIGSLLYPDTTVGFETNIIDSAIGFHANIGNNVSLTRSYLSRDTEISQGEKLEDCTKLIFA